MTFSKELLERIEALPHYEETYMDGLTSNPKQFEDDGFIHIIREQYRFVFYNGQEKGCLKEKDVIKYSNLVDNILSSKQTPEEKWSENGKLAFPVCLDCGKRHYRRFGTACINQPKKKMTFLDLLDNSQRFSGEIITKSCGGLESEYSFEWDKSVFQLTEFGKDYFKEILTSTFTLNNDIIILDNQNITEELFDHFMATMAGHVSNNFFKKVLNEGV